MNDGGTLYRWREDQRQYAPESVKHALVCEENKGVARDWWEGRGRSIWRCACG